MSSNFKHTPGPWMSCKTIDNNNVKNCQLVLQEKRINARNIAILIPCMGMPPEEVEANAARIVDCVNAMAGIEDPQKLRETWDAIAPLKLDAYENMKQQRDLLLEAIKYIEQLHPKDNGGREECYAQARKKVLETHYKWLQLNAKALEE